MNSLETRLRGRGGEYVRDRGSNYHCVRVGGGGEVEGVVVGGGGGVQVNNGSGWRRRFLSEEVSE